MAQLGQRQLRRVTSSILCAGQRYTRAPGRRRGASDIIAVEPMTSSSSQFIYQSGDIMLSESIFELQPSNRLFYCLYQNYYKSGIPPEMIPAFVTINQV